MREKEMRRRVRAAMRTRRRREAAAPHRPASYLVVEGVAHEAMEIG